jgi:hypothetical protein
MPQTTARPKVQRLCCNVIPKICFAVLTSFANQIALVVYSSNVTYFKPFYRFRLMLIKIFVVRIN